MYSILKHFSKPSLENVLYKESRMQDSLTLAYRPLYLPRIADALS